MANTTPELRTILSAMEVDRLTALSKIYDDRELWKKFREVLDQLIMFDDRKVLRELKDTRTVDEAVHQTSRQNFYRGRTSAWVVIHGLIINAKAELEKREAKNG